MSTEHDPAAEPLNAIGRALGGRFSSAIVQFHAAVAERLGLNVTDWKFAELLARTGPTNPGRLSELTGMTTAATTQVINRLESSGIVVRERDECDRRKVMVRLADQTDIRQATGMIFAELGEEMGKMMSRFTPSELVAIQSFVENTTVIMESLATKLRRERA